MEFLFCLHIFFLKTFPCLTEWPPTISWRFLLHLNAIIGLVWNTAWNWVFICRIILDTTESVLLYVIDSGILFLLLFSLFVNSSFLSILSTFLICSCRTSSLHCLSRNFCLVLAQFLSCSLVVEQIVFSIKAWIHRILLFRDLTCSELACKNAFSSVGLWYKVV